MTLGLENLFIFGKFSDFFLINTRDVTRGHNSPGAESLLPWASAEIFQGGGKVDIFPVLF